MPGIVVIGIGGPPGLGIDLTGLLSPEGLIEHAREHVQECRDGNYSEAACLVGTVRGELLSLEELGITEEELEEFRQKGVVEPAKRYVEECRDGDYEHLGSLIDWLSIKTVTEEELGITEEELNGFIKQENLRTAKDIIAECREDDYRQLGPILAAISNGMFTVEELETSKQELGEFMIKRRLGSTQSSNGSGTHERTSQSS
ncbi:MAG TPA: hypothetical protein VIF43_00425 [Patescibacteria group bacterium]|jgi:hypothetical protein